MPNYGGLITILIYAATGEGGLVGDFILTESGDDILTENGLNLMTET